jgi:hypothetical protein
MQSTLNMMSAHSLCDSVGTPRFRRFLLSKLKEWHLSGTTGDAGQRGVVQINNYLTVRMCDVYRSNCTAGHHGWF